MARFIKAESLTSSEIEERVASGELRYCALGPCDGRWLVVAEPDSDPNEIIAGLPGTDLIHATEIRYAEDEGANDE